ncbi:MAG: hypothetical protein AB7E55_26640 [Pigmentiphaga sp.]
MALNYEFLIARADEAARDARAADLENVRERALRSEAAWREMAASALKTEKARAKKAAAALAMSAQTP